MTYRFTKDRRFLQTAQRAADYFIKNLPVDFVPYWDFQAPKIPDEPRDASAAAIAASGLFELSTFAADTTLRTKYFKAAENILNSLCSSSYLAEGTSSHGILNHCVGHRPNNSEIDVSLIYADYYFLEALYRYKSLL
jgi:unsaturated chondroitin disaccharide hydrolase